MLDLGQLRSFVEVAERGTVASAAASLGYTPPAVSQHIAKLEAELGVRLFDRASKRLRLTDAGGSLVPVALTMIDLDFQARAAVAEPVARPHYVVAGFASALGAIVVPLLPTIRQAMTIDVVESEDADALRDLRIGAVDVVLIQEYEGLAHERDDRLTFVPVVRDRLRLVMPDRFAPSTTLVELTDEPWLLNGQGTRCTDATTRILEAAGLQPQISATVADNETLLALVAGGHGVTIAPELLLADGRLGISVASQDLGISRTIYAVHRTVTTTAVTPLLTHLTTAR